MPTTVNFRVRSIDHSSLVQSESGFGATATREKVRCYQTILKIVVADPSISLNGNHNDPATRRSLRKLQEHYNLKPTSYLTVESNVVLIQIALEWIYRIRISRSVGTSAALTDMIRKFQNDYGLVKDGKVGPQTRTNMVKVLLAKLPTPIKNFHSKLGPAGGLQRKNELSGVGSWETVGSLDVNKEMIGVNGAYWGPSGIRGQDDRRPVALPAGIPWRWICRIKIDGSWAGSGVLISPRHILTAGHTVYDDKNDEQGFRRYSMTRSLVISPAFDGHVLRRNRQFNKRAPFGNWSVDMNRIFLPLCYTYRKDIADRPPTNIDCDLAVLTLKSDIGRRKFTTKKTIREKGRNRYVYNSFDPLGYWGIDKRHQIVAYKPGEKDNFKIYSGGYPGSSKGIMQQVGGRVDNRYIAGRFITRSSRYIVDRYLNRFATLLDMTPGQSGSPVWRRTSTKPKIRKMIGLAVFQNETFNNGVALTPALLSELADWAPQTFWFDGLRLRVRQ